MLGVYIIFRYQNHGSTSFQRWVPKTRLPLCPPWLTSNFLRLEETKYLETTNQLMTKPPFVMTKPPFLMTKPSFLMTKPPFVMMKPPFLMMKPSLLMIQPSFLMDKSPSLSRRTDHAILFICHGDSLEIQLPSCVDSAQRDQRLLPGLRSLVEGLQTSNHVFCHQI